VGTRILYISVELCEQVTDQLKTLHYALQVDDVPVVVKDSYFITSVWYVMENDIKEGFLLMVELCHWKCSV
jgi:hypothetical protein